MTSKVKGTEGIEFPDATVQGSAADKGPAFSVVRTFPQNLTSDVAAVVVFDGVIINDATAYNPASGAFQPLKAGAYQFNAAIGFAGVSGTFALIELYKNGQPLLRLDQAVGPLSAATLSGSAIVECNGSSDYIQIYATVNGSGAIVNSLGSVPWITSFSGALVRKA